MPFKNNASLIYVFSLGNLNFVSTDSEVKLNMYIHTQYIYMLYVPMYMNMYTSQT